MKPQQLTDGSGRWFYPDSCKQWERRVTQDEVHREIRGEQLGDFGEILYFTEESNFILRTWDTNCSEDTEYKAIGIEEAARWLIFNGYHADLAKLEMSVEAKKLKL